MQYSFTTIIPPYHHISCVHHQSLCKLMHPFFLASNEFPNLSIENQKGGRYNGRAPRRDETTCATFWCLSSRKNSDFFLFVYKDFIEGQVCTSTGHGSREERNLYNYTIVLFFVSHFFLSPFLLELI